MTISAGDSIVITSPVAGDDFRVMDIGLTVKTTSQTVMTITLDIADSPVNVELQVGTLHLGFETGLAKGWYSPKNLKLI